MQYFTGLDANKEFRSYCVDGNIVSMSTFSLGYFDPSSTPTGPSIDQVNGDDIIDHGQTFQVKGQFPTTITGVKITEGGRETSVGFSNQTGTTVDCGPLDVFAGDAQLGSVLIEVTDGTETDTHPITVVSGAGYVDVTLADPILATGAVKELTVAAGQQLAIEAGAGTSVNTLYDDSDMLLNPAAVNGQVYQRHHHDGSTWNSDTITIYRGSFTGVQWIGDLNPPDAVVGKQYDYLFGGLLTGDRPMTFTLATGSLPDGITIDDTAEKITGIATTAISLTGISITADNSVAGASVQVSGDDV